MEKSSLCIIIAVSALHFITARQFHLIFDRKTWTDAQTYCREKYLDLATVNSMEDILTLNNLVTVSSKDHENYTDCVWIGLYDDRSTWSWSMSDSSFYKDGEAEFISWGTNQPNEYGRFNYCARTDSSGKWNDLNCEFPFKVICSDVEGQNVTFVYINVEMKWSEAQKYCREHHTDLARVRNELENDKISKLIPKEQFAWIGLFRSPWHWVDGRKPSMTYWSSGEPNSASENCAVGNFAAGQLGKWEDWSCSRETAFVCFSDTKYVVKLKLVRSSSLDLNDPTVQEDILKQLKKKLIDDTENENFRLSWKKRSDGNVLYREKKEEGF